MSNFLPPHARAPVAKRLLATVVVLAVTAGIAGLATFATFTSTTSASLSVASGTVAITSGATGSVANRFNVNATNIAPGDTIQRTVDVISTSSVALASDLLTTSAAPSNLLTSDTTNGLQLVIDRCSVAWTETGVAPAYAYTCSGTTTPVLASRAVIGTNLSLNNMTLAAGGGTDHLHATITLPTTADNTFQGIAATTITFAFTGTQRAATSQ